MNLRFLLLAAILVAPLAACKEDPVVSNGPVDPTLPAAPCDSATSTAVGTNGFLLSGAGYGNLPIKFETYTSSTEYIFGGTQGGSIRRIIYDTVALPDANRVPVVLEMQIPGYQPGAYPFNTLAGPDGAYVRLEMNKPSGFRVYKSTEGKIQLDSFINGAQAYGRLCGYLKDSSINSTIAITGARFSP